MIGVSGGEHLKPISCKDCGEKLISFIEQKLHGRICEKVSI